MEVTRCRFRDDEQTLIIDIPVEKVEGVVRSINGLTYFGEWLDGEGTTYQFAVRYDGQIDFGQYGKDCGQVAGKLSIHGRPLVSNAVFEYRSSIENFDFELIGTFDGQKWTSHVTIQI